MIFEIICTDEETVCVAMDHETFNEVHKMIVVAAYHKGQKEPNRDLSKESEDE